MAKSKDKKRKKGSTNKSKGDLLERLVELIHEGIGVRVDRKARLPVSSKRARKREIDVLLTSSPAGYPVRIAIECKNWRHAVGIAIIDGFVGKLDQVGIPRSLGIVVSAHGYTRDAQQRALDAKIRLLTLEGLTASRMSQIVQEAFQSIVYVTLRWQRMSHLPVLPQAQGPLVSGALEVVGPPMENERLERWALRLIWDRWRSDQIPLQLGESVIVVRDPTNDGLGAVIVDVQVHGQVVTVPGELREVTLRNAITGHVEKKRLDTDFSGRDDTLLTTRIASEADLQKHFRKGRMHLILGRIRVPRLELHGGWFPPSKRALKRFVELRKAGQEVSFETIEGLNLRRAWDEPMSFNEWRTL